MALAGLAKQIRCVPVCVTKQQYEVESHEQPQTWLDLNNRFIGLYGVGTSPSGGHRPVAQSQSDGVRCEQHPFAAIEHRVTHSDDTFHYRYDANKQQLLVDKIAYQGVRAAEVLKHGNSSQLALAVSQPRFGLQVIKVAVNLTGQPYEGMGYYWVAQGSIKQNLPALKQLLTERELTGGMVSETAQGNVRVDCTIVG